MIFEILVFVVVLLIAFYFILKIKEYLSRRRLLKKYNPYDDLSKRGEERRSLGGRESGIESPEFEPPRPDQPERGWLLPTTDTTPTGETDTSSGSVSREKPRYPSRLDIFKKLQK